jgi:hypothetical protein
VGRWYLAEFFSDFDHPANASEWYSPVRIHHWKTDPDHPELHSLAFFHANYPEGVQDKSYACRIVGIVGHTSRCLLLAVVDDALRNQHLWLRPLTWRIMEKTFPDFTRSLSAMPKAATLLQTALDAKFQFKRNSR